MADPNGDIQIGVVTTGEARPAQELEARLVDSLWVGGHLASRNPSPEAMVGLARLATVTQRVVVGTSILLLPLYPPALVAKQVAELDRASGGRVMLGVGVGGEYPQEFSAVQVPIEERGRRADESIPLIRRLWTGTEVSHDGPHYAMQGVRIHPIPVQPGGPPIVVAGRKERAMQRAAAMGDGWFPYMYSPGRYAESVAKIEKAAADAGRTLDRFQWLVWIFLNINPDGDAAREQAAKAMGLTFDRDLRPLVERVAAAGTIREVTSKLLEFYDAGARHFVFLPVAGHAGESSVLDALFGDVVPGLKEHAAQRRDHAE